MTPVHVLELTEKTWPALEKLFGPKGADAGCWCMFFRLPGPEFRTGLYEPNRAALRELAGSGEPVGLLAMDGEDAVGWVAVAPRPVYRRLERSTVAKPVDPDEDLSGVWSVTCFYIHRGARRSGVSRLLLDEAVRYAAEHGARVVEGYPVDTGGRKKASAELYHGTLSTFTAAGFSVVERRGVRRALVRKVIG
ncbi:MAG TPA: GNAT family N-acetyltransferase [Actinophytocola sp.]|uniref:GNAT family N-acetyltransferase n=1 Tax=Actinophytocola sp. TaxID=1872138 RepID=UPI002DDCC771|nr:GNAT family N-acetyltransferase [Actinophytocola sp.]HEV2784648.1 GNAT family N-acetyltransferase [Actinophytocola sp.]